MSVSSIVELVLPGSSNWPSSCMFTRQMLPSSHAVPINDPPLERQSASHVLRQSGELEAVWNETLFDHSKIDSKMQTRTPSLLANEFTEFIRAASRLENSYHDLQEEVAALRVELSERNVALNTSLAQNESMRTALQQIVDSMPCGVLVIDRDGRVSMINPESTRLLGIEPARASNYSRLTLQEIKTLTNIDLEGIFKSASLSDAEQKLCIPRSSGKRWLEVRNRRIIHRSELEDPSPQTILILRDITTQKIAEQERESGRKAMALAEISTIVAHEVRNPLASLELFAELIENDESRRSEWISNLRAGIRSLAVTVNNVLSLHSSGALKLTPVCLFPVLDSAIKFARPLADQAGISLLWCSEFELLSVMGNESAIRQVVLNLVSNAIRHTKEGGTVSISVKPEIGVRDDSNCGIAIEHLVVEFSDTGCGIQPDQIDHIFEPGFSGNGDTSGLGLAVCDRIVREHGGRISVSSQRHRGSKFALHLPVLRTNGAIA